MRGRGLTGGHLAGIGAAWVGGVALQLQQATLWPTPGYVVLAALACALLAWRPRRSVSWCLAAAALSFACTGWRADMRLAETLPTDLQGQDLALVGVVASLPDAGPSGVRFEFEVAQARLQGRPVALPRRVSLGWWRQDDADPLPTPPRAGDRWRLTVRLRQPHGAMNPHGFDYELWLFERGVRATGYVRASPAPERLGPDPGSPLLRLRQGWRDAIERQVPDPRAAGVLAALTVGDQAAIERPDWDLFRRTGIAHLVSISGLHITMFAWLAAALVGALWRRSMRLGLWLPAPQAARWGGLALATAYALLAGWGVPAQRTLAMLAVVVLLRSLGWRWPDGLVLLAAAVAVTLIDPWALMQAGFWLSFMAVGLLMLSETRDRVRPLPDGWLAHLRAAVATGLRTQAVATAGLAPLTLLFFQQVSVVGFLANLLAIPLVTLAITPMALLGVAWAPLWQGAAALLHVLTAVLSFLAAWPGAVWTAAAAPPWTAAAGLLGGALLVAPIPWRLRACGAAMCLPLLWPAVPAPPPGRFEMVALDVGQGTAVLLRTQRHLLVYDAGPAYSPDADAADRVLLPLLTARGERRIDRLILSHRDTDHVGGAARLLAHWPVGEVISSLSDDHPLRALPVPQSTCAKGQRWQWDGVEFEILHPAAPLPVGARSNALSCVLRVEDAGGASVLLTGDIEAAQEAALVVDRAPLRSVALMVPHHGSKTSSSAAFLDAVAPRLAFVQAGYRSRFGHPAPAVVARYEARGIALRRSDSCGAWTWDGQGPGECERERRHRYWHHLP